MRSLERLIAHYKLEHTLADKLRNAPAVDRAVLYGRLYSELFASLDDHPQRTKSASALSGRVSTQLALLQPYLRKHATFLEIGCGDAAVSIASSSKVGTSIGVDVTDALLPKERPANFQFSKTDGVDLNIPAESVDVAYSNQLMEHLHPDDAFAQLKEIRRILKPSGIYVCTTPSRLTGPHDISRYFEYTATGFHLKEYDYAQLRSAFQRAGFRKFKVIFFAKGRQLSVPYSLARALEICFGLLPSGMRALLASSMIGRICFGMICIGTR